MTARGLPGGTESGPEATALGDAVLAREPGALERALGLTGSDEPDARALARAAIERWARRTGKSVRLALVGADVPVGAFAGRLVDDGHRVAVLRTAGEADAAERALGAREGGFAAALPGGDALAAAFRLCEIAGYDTLLAIGGGDRPDAGVAVAVDCAVRVVAGTPEASGGGVDLAVPIDGATDEAGMRTAWAAIRRWRLDAIDRGEHETRREAQRKAWEAEGQ